MARIYLSINPEKRQPQNDGYVAVISRGSPQAGDKVITILSVEVLESPKLAKEWFKKQMKLKPWKTRH